MVDLEDLEKKLDSAEKRTPLLELQDELYPLGILVSCYNKGKLSGGVLWEFFWIEDGEIKTLEFKADECNTDDTNEVCRLLKCYLDKCMGRFSSEKVFAKEEQPPESSSTKEEK